jgi:mannose-6-phosphate isomerase-like protein (cupin superfamily)
VRGAFVMELRDRTIALSEGELLIVPRGVEHRPIAEREVQVTGRWIAVGVAIGAGVGVAIKNIAVGVGVGVAVGALLGLLAARRSAGAQ